MARTNPSPAPADAAALAITPTEQPSSVDPHRVRRTPTTSEFRITKDVGRQLDELISLPTAEALMAELCRKDDVDPAVLDGPEWTAAYFHIRISGLDLEGSNTPYNHLRNMARYAYRSKLRPVFVRFERQSGFKLTESKNLHRMLDADGRPRRRRRHHRNYDRKGWIADFHAIECGELRVGAVLTHSMDRFARRERTGQQWMDMLMTARIKLVETRDLNVRPRYLTEERLYNS